MKRFKIGPRPEEEARTPRVRNFKASCYRRRALRSVLGASDQLSNPAVASEPICGEVGAWLTILKRALRFTSERSCRHRC